MRKLVVAEFISLDGVIQAPGGAEEDQEEGFAHGGWTHPYWHDDIGVHFDALIAASDALLLGRVTWQLHAQAFEPLPDGDANDAGMNALAKYVVSTTLDTADAWRNSTLIRGDVVEQVRALKAQPGKNILTDGSSVLAHTLIRHDLVDEYVLHVYPLVLGSGKKLFPDDLPVNLQLIEVKPIPTGVVFMRYVPARPA